MDLDQLAAQLFNRRRAESQSVLTDATTRTYIGTATADSHDGMVTVTLNGYETPAEDVGELQGYGSIEFPCGPNVREGDSVVVSAVGGTTLKAPMVVSSSGSGDRQQAEIDAAAEVANATAQHFWADTNGAHVSTDADDPEGAQNALWNSLGMLFRKGSNNLLALVTGNDPGVLIYDGGGNAAANIVASFVGNLIELGKGSANAVIKMCGGTGTISVDSGGSFVVSYGTPSQTTPQIGLNGGWPGGVGDLAQMTVAQVTSGGESRASVMVVGESGGCAVHLEGARIQGSAGGTVGEIRPMGLYSASVTTPANDGADVAVSFGSGFTVLDTSYAVILTPEGAPNGFTSIAYTVTNKTISGFTIHAYNDYSQPITQTINALVMHA